jgi:hypothetical protein
MKKQGKNLRSFNIEEEADEDELVEVTYPRDTGHVHLTMVTDAPLQNAQIFGA